MTRRDWLPAEIEARYRERDDLRASLAAGIAARRNVFVVGGGR